MLLIKQNQATAALKRIIFKLVDSVDGFTPKLAITFAAGELKLSKNGAAEVNIGGTVTEVAGGVYYYNPTTAELDTLGYLSLRTNKATVRDSVFIVQIVVVDMYVPLDTAILDLTDGVEVGVTFRTALKLMLSVLAGKVSGAGTVTNVFRNAVADSKNRVTATVDSSGNRSAISYDVS